MSQHTPSKGLKLLIGLSLFMVAGTAAAQQPTQAQIGAIKQSCRADYQANCSNVPTGGSAALQCLQGHMASLSPPCQTAVGAVAGGGGSVAAPQAARSSGAPASSMSPRQEVAVLRRSCGRDYRAYCQGVQPGGGRGMACLAANETRLSPGCRGALAEAHGAR